MSGLSLVKCHYFESPCLKFSNKEMKSEKFKNHPNSVVSRLEIPMKLILMIRIFFQSEDISPCEYSAFEL
jgi:hypothetical protein